MTSRLSALFLIVTIALMSGAAIAEDSRPAAAPVIATDVLCGYVKDKKVLAIAYKKDPADAPARGFQPYAVGTTNKKSILLFGYQVSGYSKTKKGADMKLPDWRNFTVKKITNLQAPGGTFETIDVPPESHKHIKEFICKNDAVK